MGNGLSDRKADTQELMQIRQEAYEAASSFLRQRIRRKEAFWWWDVLPAKLLVSGSEAFPVQNWDRHFLTAYIRQLRKRRYFWPLSAVSI